MLLLAMGCNRKDGMSQKLDSIDRLCDSDPRLAISMLDSIDPAGISSKDRHYYDLLTIKSRDKAYIRHTSDSLILDVIDYYTRHRKEGLYAQALYYGGRVYSDLGDLPTALEYFQKALDCKPEIDQNLQFKSAVLSQAGRLLKDIRLYPQALPYIQQSVEISKQLNDSLGVVYDDILLTSLYTSIDSLDQAKRHLSEAILFSANLPREDKAWLEVKNAAILYKEQRIDSALKIVRTLPNSVDSLCQNYTLSVATKIYLAAGVVDTAYMYAFQLANNKDFNNRINGFQSLFSKEVYPIIPTDSIQKLISAFSIYMENYLARYEAEDAVFKNSMYNYDLHLKARNEAEKAKKNTIYIASVIIVILIFTILFLVIKNLSTEIKLLKALDVVNRIMSEMKLTNNRLDNHHPLDITENEHTECEYTHYLRKYPIGVEIRNPIKGLLAGRTNQQILKQELLDKLIKIGQSSEKPVSADEYLLESKEMKQLKKAIDSEKAIIKNDRLWVQIEKAVHTSAHDFKDKLQKLTLGKMTDGEYKVALLTRFGIQPKDIATLLGRSRSAISDRRSILSMKVFEQTGMNNALDNLILRL